VLASDVNFFLDSRKQGYPVGVVFSILFLAPFASQWLQLGEDLSRSEECEHRV